MKIAITSLGKTLDSELDPRFGRAQYFLIYDLDSDQVVDTIDNNANVSASGGAGTSAAGKISDTGVTAVISGNFGPNASKGLTAFSVKMFQSSVQDISSVIADYKAGRLNEVSGATVPGHQ